MAHAPAAPDRRFRAYLERLSRVLDHRDRQEPLRAYVTGLCLPGERKSIEPMAARVDPRHVRARRGFARLHPRAALTSAGLGPNSRAMMVASQSAITV